MAGVVATSCKKDNNGPSEEQLWRATQNDRLRSDLYGNVKSVETLEYGRLAWDTTSNKPVTPTAVTSKSLTEYNNDGFSTRYQNSRNMVTACSTLDNQRIKVTATELRVTEEGTTTYDSKNREISSVDFSYNYSISYGGQTISSWDNSNWANDTLYSSAYNSNPFLMTVDSSYSSKTETTYDDAAKQAVVIRYEWSNGKWVEDGKTVYALNQWGFIDESSSYSRYNVKATAFEEKPYYTDYYEKDGQGNWILNYSYASYSSNNETVNSPYSYSTRTILYY